MIDFNPISIFEVQSAPATLPCLFLQEFGFDATQEVVLAEPLAPVQEISIIRASRPLDFDMALDMRLRVIPQSGFSVGEYPAFAFIHMPVFVGYPTFAFVWMPIPCPMLELEKEDVFTVIEDFGCDHAAVIPGPSINFRI